MKALTTKKASTKLNWRNFDLVVQKKVLYRYISIFVLRSIHSGQYIISLHSSNAQVTRCIFFPISHLHVLSSWSKEYGVPSPVAGPGVQREHAPLACKN